jgi:hypothetical protein
VGAAKALKWLKQNRVSMAVDFLVRQNRPAAGLRRLREENLAKDQVSTKTLGRSLCTCSTFLASPVP